MMLSSFWKNWLYLCAAFGILFGLILAAAAIHALSAPTEGLMALMNQSEPVELSRPMRFSLALMGCVTVAWGATMAVLFTACDGLGPAARPYWRASVAILLIWFVADSSFSIATGFALNAVSNTLFVVAFLIPILASGVLTRSPSERG